MFPQFDVGIPPLFLECVFVQSRNWGLRAYGFRVYGSGLRGLRFRGSGSRAQGFRVEVLRVLGFGGLWLRVCGVSV